MAALGLTENRRGFLCRERSWGQEGRQRGALELKPADAGAEWSKSWGRLCVCSQQDVGSLGAGCGAVASGAAAVRAVPAVGP